MLELAPRIHDFVGMGRGFHSGSVKRPRGGNNNTDGSCLVLVLMIVVMVHLSWKCVATKLLQGIVRYNVQNYNNRFIL